MDKKREKLAEILSNEQEFARKITKTYEESNQFKEEISNYARQLSEGAIGICVKLNDYMDKHPNETAIVTKTLEYTGEILNLAFKFEVALASGPVGLATAIALDQVIGEASAAGLDKLANEMKRQV